MRTKELTSSERDAITPAQLSRVMELFLEGRSHQEISAETDLSSTDIYHAIKNPLFVQKKDELIATKKVELELACAQVLDLFKAGLRGDELTPTQHEFVKLYFKHINPKQPNIAINITAEELVAQILTGPLPEGVEAQPPERYNRK